MDNQEKWMNSKRVKFSYLGCFNVITECLQVEGQGRRARSGVMAA